MPFRISLRTFAVAKSFVLLDQPKHMKIKVAIAATAARKKQDEAEIPRLQNQQHSSAQIDTSRTGDMGGGR
jgi:hypothetical protein